MLDLFQTDLNLLPKDGEVNYHGKIVSKTKADELYEQLIHTVCWAPDQAKIFGKLIETKRKVAWYGNREFEYTYSGITKKALIWNETLLEIKKITEEYSQESFNSCLLNLYHDGSEGMAWHSDAEKDLKPLGTIASLSFGAERKFAFKHKKDKQVVSVHLEHGSLLLMKGSTQLHWLHRLPPTKLVKRPRINLTFRTIVN